MGGLPEHRLLQNKAIKAEGNGHRALLGGNLSAACRSYAEATRLYRSSFEVAPPGAEGRLIGMLKTSVLAGDASAATDAARYTRMRMEPAPDGPAGWYALGLAAMIDGDDDTVIRAAAGMRRGTVQFRRAASAMVALARGDQDRYVAVTKAIVRDFEGRKHHLTKVPIADTALVLERFAEQRDITVHIESPILP